MRTKLSFLLLFCAAMNTQAQRVINLNDPNADISWAAITENIPQKLPDIIAAAYRNFALNPALQSPSTVSVGDTIVLQIFENPSHTTTSRLHPFGESLSCLTTVRNASTDASGQFTLRLTLIDHPPAAYATIRTDEVGKSRVEVFIPGLGREFISRDGTTLFEVSDKVVPPCFHGTPVGALGTLAKKEENIQEPVQENTTQSSRYWFRWFRKSK